MPKISNIGYRTPSSQIPLPLVGRGRGGGREVMRMRRRSRMTSRPPPCPPPNKLALGRAQARPGWGEGKISVRHHRAVVILHRPERFLGRDGGAQLVVVAGIFRLFGLLHL